MNNSVSAEQEAARNYFVKNNNDINLEMVLKTTIGRRRRLLLLLLPAMA